MRPTVTAGLAKAAELVNQMAAVMYAPTAHATVAPACSRTDPQITASRPNVGNELREPRAPATSGGVGDTDRRQAEHDVGGDDADDRTEQLRPDVGWHVGPAKPRSIATDTVTAGLR